MTYQEEQAAIRQAVEAFPETFGLRAFPDHTFRLNERQSYVRSGEQVVLVVDIKTPEGWKNFSTGTPTEIRREIPRERSA